MPRKSTLLTIGGMDLTWDQLVHVIDVLVEVAMTRNQY